VGGAARHVESFTAQLVKTFTRAEDIDFEDERQRTSINDERRSGNDETMRLRFVVPRSSFIVVLKENS
jgi:hypothetical protein